MIEGLEILIDRMKTHPEEFISEGHASMPSKWDRLIDHYRHVLTDEEMKAYNTARHELTRQQFTATVLQTLLYEPSQLAPETITFSTQGRDPWSAPALISNQHATTTAKLALELQKEQLEQIKQIMKDELQQATKKRSR
jgi:hypothetical protein